MSKSGFFALIIALLPLTVWATCTENGEVSPAALDGPLLEPLRSVLKESTSAAEFAAQIQVMDQRHPLAAENCVGSQIMAGDPDKKKLEALQAGALDLTSGGLQHLDMNAAFEPMPKFGNEPKETGYYKGTDKGHQFLFLKGVCPDPRSSFPQLVLCSSLPAKERKCDGVGISVDDFLANRNWVSTCGSELFFYGVSDSEIAQHPHDASAMEMKKAEKYGVFKGVQLHGPMAKYSPAEQEWWATLQGMGTDHAIARARNVSCRPHYYSRAEILGMVDALNRRNQPYAEGKAVYHYNGLNDNCAVNNAAAFQGAGVSPDPASSNNASRLRTVGFFDKHFSTLSNLVKAGIPGSQSITTADLQRGQVFVPQNELDYDRETSLAQVPSFQQLLSKGADLDTLKKFGELPQQRISWDKYYPQSHPDLFGFSASPVDVHRADGIFFKDPTRHVSPLDAMMDSGVKLSPLEAVDSKLLQFESALLLISKQGRPLSSEEYAKAHPELVNASRSREEVRKDFDIYRSWLEKSIEELSGDETALRKTVAKLRQKQCTGQVATNRMKPLVAPATSGISHTDKKAAPAQ